MKILVIGGCGYTGNVLVNKLLDFNHKIVVLDIQWFGNHLKTHKNLKIIKKDIRFIDEKIFSGVNTIVHLANIANDPSVELNPNLSWEVNVLALNKIIEFSIKKKVEHFIYASSGSVYGIKKESKVTEELSCVPLSTYNKTKMIAERLLFSYSDKIKIHCIRPATVCGVSPRMRLDVSVNMFVYQALKKNKITVFGGNQVRPNINIKDLTDIYIHFINNPHLKTGVYNAGFENLRIIDIAKLVQKHVKTKIKVIRNNNDPRSYRQNSDKLIKTGFKPKFSVEDAIKEFKEKYINNEILINDKCYTVKWMRKIGLNNGE